MSRNASRFLPGCALAWSLFMALLGFQALLSSEVARTRPVTVPERAGRDERAGLLWQISRRTEFAFGFRNFLADIAWLKAVQVAGSGRLHRDDYDRMDVLIQTVGNLDPRFDVPYFLGGIILGDSPDHVGAALDTLERGRAHHPREWRLPFYIGYIRYFSLGDPIGAGRAVEDASRIPDSPPYLPLLASRMLSEGREPETALALLDGILRQESDPSRIEVLEKRIREVVVERDIQELEHAAEAFRRRFGRFPPTLADLVRTGVVPRLPSEPNGGRYILGPDGTVRSDRVTTRLRVFRPK